MPFDMNKRIDSRAYKMVSLFAMIHFLIIKWRTFNRDFCSILLCTDYSPHHAPVAYNCVHSFAADFQTYIEIPF